MMKFYNSNNEARDPKLQFTEAPGSDAVEIEASKNTVFFPLKDGILKRD